MYAGMSFDDRFAAKHRISISLSIFFEKEKDCCGHFWSILQLTRLAELKDALGSDFCEISLDLHH